MKHFLLILTTVLFLAAAGNVLFYEYRLRNTFSQTREKLILVVTNAALSINVDEVLKVPLRRDGDRTMEYQAVLRKLTRIKEANPFLKYVYIMTATDQPGVLQYVVDADVLPQIITAKSPHSFPGDKYEVIQFSEILNAYNRPVADKKITHDVWGTFISGYAPLRDASGKPAAILGVDIDATGIAAMEKNRKAYAVYVLIAGSLFFVSLLLSFLSRKR